MPKKNAVSEEQSSVAPTVVRPVSNAVGILKYLGRTGNAETVTNIARTLNINTSTCFNILRRNNLIIVPQNTLYPQFKM